MNPERLAVAGDSVGGNMSAAVTLLAKERGPLLLIAGEKDHTVPLAVVTAAYKLHKNNPAVTEFREISGRGHSLTIDHGWREVADIALAFIAQQLKID